ncbi:MAG: hypothetical protein JRN06_09640 [Nitrososphaerota archaeon]|nr:hypothetical protein [Nitrososphaerota archaeon]MDG7024847.1 hypothetical protein [Nitrososphaerota archaeon]
MNTKKMAIASAVGVFALTAVLVAYPAMAASGAPSASNVQQMLQHPRYATLDKIQLSTGQTVTLTSVAGGYWEVGDREVNGTASGTITLQVTGALAGGYSLSVTGGSFVINGTTYTVSSGSAELGPYGIRMVGQGQSGTAQFLFGGRDLGKFGSTSFAILRVDLKGGSSEFAARMLVSVSA